MKKLISSIVLLSVLVSSNSFAQTGYDTIPFLQPKNPEQMEFYLLTVGLGPGLHERFGHTILRVTDLEAGTEQYINWGMFNFRDPMFPLKFFLGHLDYLMGFDSYTQIVRLYSYIGRRVVEQKIHLTPKQKQKLIEKIVWNALPENRVYRYQYFFDNCSTKPRDYFDEAVGGRLAAYLKPQKIEKVFRNYVYENLNAPPFIAFSLDIMMNSRIDQELSKWEEMFLPERLQAYLMEAPAFDDAGEPIKGLNFLDPQMKVIVAGEEFPSSPLDMYHIVSAFFVFFLVCAGLLIGRYNPALHVPNKKISLGLRVLGLAAVIWGLFANGYGLIMWASWIFSQHLDLHHNLNIMLYWPIDLLLAIIGVKLLFTGRVWELSKGTYNLIDKFFVAHLLVTGLLILGSLVGLWDQDVKRALFTIVPIQLLLLFMMKAKTTKPR